MQPSLRIDFRKLIEKYGEAISDLRTFSRFMSQKESYTILYKITKYYPDLVRKTYPWWIRVNSIPPKMIPDYDYGNAIIKNYERHKYKTGHHSKLRELYWCKSKCCSKSPSLNPFEDINYANALGYLPDKSIKISIVGKEEDEDEQEDTDETNKYCNCLYC